MPVEHSLPFQRNLFIATPNAIYQRSQTGNKLLFSCDCAEGIVNARVSTNNSGVLAVADGQIVVLYDATRERKKKHILKGGDVGRPNGL